MSAYSGDVTRWGVNSTSKTEGAFSAHNGDGTGYGQDLWIPTWSGEVLHAYDQFNMFEGMVDSRTITSGTTVEFPVTGTIELKE